MIRVLIDACLLVKGNVSNAMFDLGRAGLISLHWTPEIGIQFIENWGRLRAQDEAREGLKKHQYSFTPADEERALSGAKSRALTRLGKFRLMAPEWAIPGWDASKARRAHPEKELLVGEPGGVHRGDYDVALAAIKLAEVFPKDEIWLATDNMQHLPPAILSKFDVWSVGQGTMLEELHKLKPLLVEQSLQTTLDDMRNPQITRMDMLDILSNPVEFGSSVLSDHMRQLWQSSQASGKTRRKNQPLDEGPSR